MTIEETTTAPKEAKKVNLTIFTVLEVLKETGHQVNLEELSALIQAHTQGVNQPQAGIQSSTSDKLGFFRLSTRIKHHEWNKVLDYINNPEKQLILTFTEGKNSNNKNTCSVATTVKGKRGDELRVLGYLSGYKKETLDAFARQDVVLVDAEPVDNVDDWLV